MNKLIKSSLPIAIAASLVACGGGSSNDNTARMTLSSTNLEPLGDDFDYEGWIIVDGSAVSTGKFDIVDGATVPVSFDLDLTQANAASLFVLTIEPTENDPVGPADTHILAGPITDGVANIVTDHPGAFDSDFTGSAGSFIIATPTNGNITPDQGIWYLDRTATASGGPEASLTLPTLPAGWNYEGWVVGDSGPVSTGTFTSINGADSDNAGLTAGTDADGNVNAGPPFPGQDFVNPALSLIGQAAVISVEPSPDNSPAPFSMKPLRATGIVAPTLPPAQGTDDMPMTNISADNLPSGTVTIDFN